MVAGDKLFCPAEMQKMKEWKDNKVKGSQCHTITKSKELPNPACKNIYIKKSVLCPKVVWVQNAVEAQVRIKKAKYLCCGFWIYKVIHAEINVTFKNSIVYAAFL